MSAAPARVLVVDDDPAYGRLTELVLLDGLPAGTEVAVAASLGEALHVAAQAPPRCVLLDLSLPDADGLEAIGRLREAGVGATVLVLSGRTDAGIAQDARRHGADGYLVKGDDGLVAAVAAALS